MQTTEHLPTYAVLGHPIAHSLSPKMHTAALAALSIGHPQLNTATYGKFDVPPSYFAPTLKKLHSGGVQGLNLTLPHKTDVLQPAFIAQTGLSITPASAAVTRMGAANTLVRTQTGWVAHNTDGDGLTQALKQRLNFSWEGSVVTLLGAGGAARAAAVTALEAGCTHLYIINRNPERLNTLVKSLLAHLPYAGRVSGVEKTDSPQAKTAIHTALASSHLVLNATSLGMKQGDPAPVPLLNSGKAINPMLKVFDMVYNPPHTQFLNNAQGINLPFANGKSMLVWQGAQALCLWLATQAIHVTAEELAPHMEKALM